MIINLVLIILSAFATFYLSKSTYVTPVLASSLVAGLGFLGCSYLGHVELTPYIFGASFVGMSHEKVLSTLGVLIAAILFFMTFSFLVDYLDGYGGLLGMSAFIGVVTARLSFYCFELCRTPLS